MKYYAMLDTEEIVYLGNFETIDEAFEVEPHNAHWIFSEPGLRDAIDNAKDVLENLPT